MWQHRGVAGQWQHLPAAPGSRLMLDRPDRMFFEIFAYKTNKNLPRGCIRRSLPK